MTTEVLGDTALPANWVPSDESFGARPDITEPPAGTIRVCGKGGRVDEIPTHRRIWVHVRGRGPGPLVRDTQGRPYLPGTLSHLFVVHLRRDLGIPDVTLHDLRRLYGNQLRCSRLPDGRPVDMDTVRRLMRHRSLATTQRYLYVREEEQRQAIDALPLPR